MGLHRRYRSFVTTLCAFFLFQAVLFSLLYFQSDGKVQVEDITIETLLKSNCLTVV